MSDPTTDEMDQLSAERDRVETSPAQPDDAHRIDPDDVAAEPGTPHVKHDRTPRMQH